MAMTDQEQKDLRSYCAFILREYGFHFSPNDPVVPALYIIHKEMQLNNQNNKAIAGLVKEASSRINPTVFNFNSRGEALKFQLGMAVKWILSGGIILLFIWVAVWRWSMGNDLDKAGRIIKEAEHMRELLGRAKTDKAGAYFIDFTETKEGSIRPFMKYRRLNDSTVRVHLGK